MHDLDRASVYVVGAMRDLSRAHLRRLATDKGAVVRTSLSRDVTLVAVANDAARELLAGTRLLSILERIPDGAALISERAFQQRLGLAAPPAEARRDLTSSDLARLSGLDEDLLFWLALFDVVEPVDGRYGYRDLVVAREVERLLLTGCDLADVVTLSVELSILGLRLSEVRLGMGADGRVYRLFGERAAQVDGQYVLALVAPPDSVDDVFVRAETAELEGDYTEAERLYRRALDMDPSDPTVPFNLGNTLEKQGRGAEARIFWRLAIERDGDCVEAWFNLAVSAEETGRRDEACEHYCRALNLAPDYGDAVYNLALLLHDLGRFGDALPMWERFIKLEPRSSEAKTARRRAADCRMRERGLTLIAV